MATNADEILNPTDFTNDSGVSDEIMNKHFEAAGIVDEEDATKGDANSSAEAGNKESEAKGDKKPEADPSNSDSSGKDGASKSGDDGKAKEEKGKTFDPNALTGEAKQFYQQYNVERQRTLDLNNQLKQMTQSRNSHLDRFKDLERTIQSTHGVDAPTLATGAKIVNDLKTDPVGTVKKLVAEVLAAGYSIEGIGAGIDTAAITRLLEARLPDSRVQDQGRVEQQIDQEVAQEVNQFYANFPDARVHETTLVRVLNDHPEFTLSEAYFELKQAFAGRGFDWSKALDQQQVAPVVQDKKELATGNTKPLVNGRPAVDPSDAGKTVVASVSTSSADIIKEAMRDAGLNI